VKNILSVLTGPASSAREASSNTALTAAKSKRDRLRSDLAAAKAEGERGKASSDAAKGRLRSAVEEGDAEARAEAVAELGRLSAEAAANHELAGAIEDALAKAEAALTDAEATERLRMTEAALEETEASFAAALEAVGPAWVPFAEARGRVHDLAERRSRLKARLRALGGKPKESPFGATELQIAASALVAMYGDHVISLPAGEPYFGSTLVRGLAGPEPKTEPEFES